MTNSPNHRHAGVDDVRRLARRGDASGNHRISRTRYAAFVPGVLRPKVLEGESNRAHRVVGADRLTEVLVDANMGSGAVLTGVIGS